MIKEEGEGLECQDFGDVVVAAFSRLYTNTTPCTRQKKLPAPTRIGN